MTKKDFMAAVSKCQKYYGRVFISDAAAHFNMSLSSFKAAAIEAHFAGVIEMEQADLPDKFDSEKIKASAAVYMGFHTFHFIVA